jgi:26S proteasome regulatory subunit N2
MATATMSISSGPPPAVPTASGYIALLQEPDTTLRAHALQKLLDCVGTLWHEVAESLPELETIAEDLDLPLAMRQTAAAVASRVFFHLEEPSQALRLALEAGEAHFDLSTKTPYVERLVSAALDAYVKERRRLLEDDTAGGDEAVGIPMDQLQGMVHRLIETCCAEQRYEHALGIALEAQESKTLQDILNASGPAPAMLKYALQATVKLVTSKAFRQEALGVIAACLFKQLETRRSAAVDLLVVYQLLGNSQSIADVLVTLLNGSSEEDALLAYQLCFDLVDSGDQAFCNRVAEALMSKKPADDNASSTERWGQVEKVLTGGFSSELALSFLHKQSKADRLIMENLKKSLEERGSGGRSSVLHNSAVVTHCYLHAGTTNDTFLRDYLDWMKKASNWYVAYILLISVFTQ